MLAQRWAEKYRPKSFAEVIGQDDAVRRLAGYITSGNAPNLILVGPSGSGKTTLSRIYGKALICEEPEPCGSPCQICANCRQVEAGSPDFRMFNGAIDSNKAHVEDALQGLINAPQFGRHHVIFFDEAHRLAPTARDAFLVPLEAGHPYGKFLFAMIDPKAFPEQVRARCRVIHLRPPSRADALAYLQRIVDAEGLSAEPSALNLIAVISASFRELAENLEAVAEETMVLLATVRTRLLFDRSLAVTAYLNSLMAGDLAGQIEALGRGRIPARERVTAIRQALAHLNLRYVVQPPVVLDDDPGDLLFDDADCRALVKAFQERADSRQVTLQRLFEHMSEYWIYAPAEIDDQILRMLIISFHQAVGTIAPYPVSTPPKELLGSARQVSRARLLMAQRNKRQTVFAPHDVRAEEHGYLNLRQTAELYEASTFLPQAYGVCFNAILTIKSKDPRRPDLQAAQRVYRLLRELRQRVEYWSKKQKGFAETLHRIVVHERPSSELLSVCVMHVPEAFDAQIKVWLAARLSELDLEAEPLDVTHPEKAQDRLIRHWHLMRKLWRGVAPTLLAGTSPLISVLRIKKMAQRHAGVVRCDRYSLSETISQSRRKAAHAIGRGHLSPWKDSAFDWLFRGWELSEYADNSSRIRDLEKRRRTQEVARRTREDPLLQLGINSLISQIDNEILIQPKMRARSWSGWW